MPKRTTLYFEQDPLGDRLRREAITSRPAFSESLHERVLAAIQASAGRDAASDDRASDGLTSDAEWLAVAEAKAAVRARGRFRQAVPSAVMGWMGRAAVVISAVCVLFVVFVAGTRFASRPMADGSPSNRFAMQDGRLDPSGARASRLATPSRLSHSDTLYGPTDRRLLASLSATENGKGSNPNLLVYDDARRAARVLFDRLPVDFRLADLALVDE